MLGQSACGDDPTGGSGPAGPPDAMLEFDANAIGGSTSGGGLDGGGGFGAFGATGGVGANGGLGGTGGLPDAASNPHCSGLPTPCSLLSNSQCASAGCSIGGKCSGASTSCYAKFSSYTCNSQEGCFWSTSSKKCSGSSWSCSLFSGSLSCAYQDGCHWSDECKGVPSPCSLYPTADCANHPGCYVEY